MFNNRVIVANKDLFIAIFKFKEKNYVDFRDKVNNYNSVFKPIAAWMLARDYDEITINDIVEHLTEYINSKKLNPGYIKVNIKSIQINDYSFEDAEEFINYVHGEFPIVRKQEEQSAEDQSERTPILTGDGIKIFRVDEAKDSKELAADTPWCIAYKGRNNMWQSYRSNQAATFYIVWDENPPTEYQRKVALQYNKNNVHITDITNRTGIKLSNEITFQYQGKTITGNDIPTYLTYLKSKGVDVDAATTNPETGQEEKILKNKPITPEEAMESELGYFVKNEFSEYSVEDIKSWAIGKFILKTPKGFIKKSDDGEYLVFTKNNYSGRKLKVPVDLIAEETPFDNTLKTESWQTLGHILKSVTFASESIKTYLTKFIGMGWIMPDDIVDYLMEVPGGKDYLIQYVNTGLQLPKTQVEKFSTNRQLINSYLKQQMIAFELGHNNGEFLQYIDTDNEEVKNKIIEENKKNSSSANLPLKWLKVLPKIGVVKPTGPGFDFGDPFINQLAITYGNTDIYEQFPTLENTKILLHFPEVIKPLKSRARAEDYPWYIFSNIDQLSDWTVRWKSVPEIFHDNPEFQVYKTAAEAGQNSYDRMEIKNRLDNNPENFLYYLILNMNDEMQYEEKHSEINKNPEFWKFAINNFNSLTNTVFKKINIMHPDIPDGYDEDVEENDINDFDEIEDEERQFISLTGFFKNMPPEILFSPDIVRLMKSNFELEIINNAVVEMLQNGQNLDSLSAYIKDFDDLAQFNNYGFMLFTQPNNVLRLLVQNNFDEQNFMDAFGNVISFQFSTFTKLIEWLPELLPKLSDESILKIISHNRGTLPREFLYALYYNKPDFINKYRDQLKIHTMDMSDFSKLTTRTEEQLKEDVGKIPPIAIDSEEDKFASIKTMVKIAQILDFKKKYKLADIITKKLF